ncbi:MAG: TlpA family protein disulfide reductase [Fimbriimonadaceae bacterium]|nr:TlpA family protein disulfide reductase [Fimbriimonadaceae bacterium]QYK57489.1 MAG: TlpA family protein disulfide reductase [Fimbriimonadaceae bacterium]
MLPVLVAIMFVEPELRSIEARTNHHNYRVLPPLGREAPGFTAPASQGGKLTVPSIAKGKKATIVSFWFYDCNICRVELPEIQRLYSELKKDGLEVVAVNIGDSAETVKAYQRNAGFSFPIALADFSVASLYGVVSFPTNLILDGQGRVIDRFIGFDERGLTRALARQGLQIPH